MPGLRERKKRQRRDTIVDAARALFIDRGFDGVTIEEIAAEADVSAGTVYTAFSTKSALLYNVLLRDLEQPVRQVDAVIGSDLQPLLVIERVIKIYFQWIDSYPIGISRSFAALALNDPAGVGRHYCMIEKTLLSGFTAAFSCLEQRGQLQAGLKAQQGARIVFNLACAEFYRMLLREDGYREDIVDIVIQQIEPIWQSLALAGEKSRR